MSMKQKYATALCTMSLAVCAGCGTQAAVAGTTAGGASGAAAGTAAAAASVACADIGQATKVFTLRQMHLVDPNRMSSLERTDTDPGQVRALLTDFCAVVTHPAPRGTYNCPADNGIGYSGTFYAGDRVLTTFVYSLTGCPSVTLRSGGMAWSSLVAGPAYQAAAGLEPDFATVVGIPVRRLYSAPGAALP